MIQVQHTTCAHDFFAGELAGTLFLAWLMVFFCIFKGVKTSGKVIYFTATFPYVMLTILLIRGITLPGSWDGLAYYLKPDFEKLKDTQVWIDAGTQVFYSFGSTFGGLVALGSYNKFDRNFLYDVTGICFVTAASSLYGGCVIFSVLGYMSYATGVPINETAKHGRCGNHR